MSQLFSIDYDAIAVAFALYATGKHDPRLLQDENGVWALVCHASGIDTVEKAVGFDYQKFFFLLRKCVTCSAFISIVETVHDKHYNVRDSKTGQLDLDARQVRESYHRYLRSHAPHGNGELPDPAGHDDTPGPFTLWELL